MNPATHGSWPTSPSLPGRSLPMRRRGVVMVMVMAVLMVASVVAYTVLTTAALQSTSTAHELASAQSQSMADSGVNLAMYYLLHPYDSPVPLVQGAAGDWHYPGQANLSIGGDSFQVSVTNPRPATFIITSTGRSTNIEGNIIERRLRVGVVGFGTWKARGAAQFSGDIRLGSTTTIEGHLVAAGSYLGGGTVTGQRLAANHTLFPGDAAWGPPPGVPQIVVPEFGKLNLVRAVNEEHGFYMHNGQKYQAQYIFTNPLLLPPAALPENPGKVFVYTGTAPLVLAGGGHQHFQGTLVVTKADLELQSQWCFIPEPGMPGLIVAGTIRLPTNLSRTRVDNLLYSGNGFSGPAHTGNKAVEVNGVLLYGGPSGATLFDGFGGSPLIRFDARKATVPDLTQQGILYDRLQIEAWESI